MVPYRRPSRGWSWCLLAAVAGGVAGACQGTSQFACSTDDECSISEAMGTCESTGYCSFPDGDCSSGRRYGMHAGEGLAGTCVDEPDADTGAATTTSPPSSTDGPMTSLDTSDDDPDTTQGGSTGEGSTSDETTGGIPADWWDPGFGYRLVIEIDPAAVTEDLEDFPLMVALDVPELARAADPQGADLRFVADGVLVPHELELYTAPRGSLLAWVRVPQVSSQRVTRVELYFGNPTPPAALPPTEVWEPGFSAVFHARDPGDATTPDSTAWGNDGAVGNDVLPVSGPLGDAYGFIAGDGIDVPSSASLTTPEALTISVWGVATSFPENTPILAGKAETYGSDPALNDYFLRAADSYLVGTVRTTTEPLVSVSSGGWSELDRWYHAALTCDGTDARLYLDGVQVDTVPCVAPIQSSMHPFRIGWWGQADPTRSWDGAIDEVRVSSVARSAAWISASHANQSSPQTFYAVGEVESI